MANLGNGIMGFFGGESSGGGGGTSTGVNGLNGTTNIGLGGALTQTTTISGAFSLRFGASPSSRISGFSTSTTSFSNLVNVASDTSEQTITLNQSSSSIGYKTSGSLLNNIILDTNSTETNFLSKPYGFKIEDRIITLGAWDGSSVSTTKTQLIVDDTNGWVYTNFFTTSQCGIFLSENNAYFSVSDGTNKIGLNVAGATKEFNAFYGGNTVNGLSLNFDTFVYKFGGFDIASNGTLLQINDATLTTSLNTDILELSGAIIDNNAPQNVGVKYLVVTLSGVEYSILCTETNL